MAETESRLAYLREYDSKKCDIRLILTLETTDGNIFSKEVIGFTNLIDPLSAMKKNLQETIFKLNVNSNENDNKENTLFRLPSNREEVEVKFFNKEKPYREDILIQDFIKLTDTKLIKVMGYTYCIISNAPLVRVLKLPAVAYVNFPVEPLDIKTYNLCKETSKFIWSKSLDKQEWNKVGEGYIYHVKESDHNHFLKLCCVPYNKFKANKGPIVEAMTENKVEDISNLPRCPFETRHALTQNQLRGNKLRIVSYNVLADRYVDGVKFPYCPPKALGIHYRKQLIIKELAGFNADVVCLQEVDDVHYKTYYQKELKKIGFKSLFNRKGNCITEGLVCAFKVNRFRLLDYKHLVLRAGIERKQFTSVSKLLKLNEDVQMEFMKQYTSLQVVILEDKSTKKIIVVGNTHLFYQPDANHIRLLQAFMCTINLYNMKNRIMKEYETDHVAVIFCGDFNSDHAQKSLYSFMTSGTIDPRHEDCLKISTSGNAVIHHKLRLECASGTPKYTNYTQEYKGCLDYIFIDKLRLSVIRAIPVASAEEMEQFVGLPNEVYPSDHLSLVVDVEFKSL